MNLTHRSIWRHIDTQRVVNGEQTRDANSQVQTLKYVKYVERVLRVVPAKHSAISQRRPFWGVAAHTGSVCVCVCVRVCVRVTVKMCVCGQRDRG